MIEIIRHLKNNEKEENNTHTYFNLYQLQNEEQKREPTYPKTPKPLTIKIQRRTYPLSMPLTPERWY